MVKKSGMQPRVRRTVRVEQNDGISLNKCSDVEHVHLTHNRCTIITQGNGAAVKNGRTRIASRRERMVGMRFGILESILRRSRG